MPPWRRNRYHNSTQALEGHDDVVLQYLDGFKQVLVTATEIARVISHWNVARCHTRKRVAAGVNREVFAWEDPECFAQCESRLVRFIFRAFERDSRNRLMPPPFTLVAYNWSILIIVVKKTWYVSLIARKVKEKREKKETQRIKRTANSYL